MGPRWWPAVAVGGQKEGGKVIVGENLLLSVRWRQPHRLPPPTSSPTPTPTHTHTEDVFWEKLGTVGGGGGGGERERERERGRQTDRQTDRQRQRQRERGRDRDKDRESQRQRQRDKKIVTERVHTVENEINYNKTCQQKSVQNDFTNGGIFGRDFHQEHNVD